ncbi:hypothetical protein L6172_09835 [Thalassospiraceae bacterium SW-3-3]|nr:hypothetical protein L6172_09835 [Thalassospiraceae bacterium SW-3-3]
MRIKRNVNGRLYLHCENPQCRQEQRLEVDGAYDVTETWGYIGPFEEPALRNVTEPEKPVTKTEPVKEPAPVVKPKQEEAVYGYDW